MSKLWHSMGLKELRLELPDSARGKGIYFLWLDDKEATETELLYIGASTQVTDRVNRQMQIRDNWQNYVSRAYRNTPQIPFNKATIYKWEGSLVEMADAEKVLIRRFRPPYNTADEHGDSMWGAHVDADEYYRKHPELDHK